MNLDIIEANAYRAEKLDIAEKLTGFHKYFATRVTPENGVYGVTEIIKDSGLVERIGTNAFGHKVKDYIVDGQITKRREILGEGNVATTLFDDNGTAYLRKISKIDNHMVKTLENRLMPNTTVVKGAFSATTDALSL